MVEHVMNYEQYKNRFNDSMLHEYSMPPGKLQAKWRGMDTYHMDGNGWHSKPIAMIAHGIRTFPMGEFPMREIEYAIVDALINEGGATAWCGDGSSCAVQIVENIWRLAKAEIDLRDRKIELLKECLIDPQPL